MFAPKAALPRRNGVTAARLAQTGACATADPFVGERNFLQAYSPDPQTEELVRGLGQNFRTPDLAFATRTTNAGLLQIHWELEEAASVSGATRLRTIWKITTPLLMPSLVAGWIWVVAHLLRTFSVPLVLASESNEVLAVLIWTYWQAGRIPEAAAIGVILILITALMGLAARRLVGESLSGLRQ